MAALEAEGVDVRANRLRDPQAVEREERVQRAVTRVAEKEGYQVILASSGDEALTILRLALEDLVGGRGVGRPPARVRSTSSSPPPCAASTGAPNTETGHAALLYRRYPVQTRIACKSLGSLSWSLNRETV